MDALTRRQFDRAMFAKDRTLAIRVGDYASRDIKEASFEYGYIKGDTYKPGGTCAGSGKITFTSIITTFNKLDILHPEIGLLVGNTYQWVKMGEYFINDIEIDRNRNTTTLELMDGMFKLNREYVTDLHFPAEVREVIQEICLKTGIELANDYFGISAMRYHIEQVPEGKKLSFRDMLSAMTQMIGMSCFFNREGKMEIRDLTESNITINADSYFLHGLTKSEIEYQIAGITCKTDKKSLTVGMKTGRSLELDNVFMTQSALNDLYYKLKNLTYYPYNLNYQGHLLLEVGQWVTIQTNKKETFKVPVLSQSFTFKGGLRGRISADSKAGNDTQYSYEGTITKQIKQQDGIEAKIQAQIEAADAAFDAEFKKRKKEIDDGIELAKAKAEEVKQELSDAINQRFDSFDNGPLKEAKRKAEEALKNAGASSLLAQEAKQIGLDSVARLEAFKSQTTSAQTALSGDLDALRRTIANDIRPKQAQAEAEIAKQVEALVQTKRELTGVKSAQATYEETTTRRLAELTNLANGKVSKSELTQTAEELTSKIASVQVGSSRNYFRNSRSRTFTTGEQGVYDYRTFIVPDFWKNSDRFKRDYVRIAFDVTFPVALANDLPAMVHFGAHPWYAYRNLVFKGGTTERQHFEFTIDLSSSSETYQTNNVFIRFGTNYGFPAGLQVVIENAMLSVGNYFPAYQPAYEDQEDRVSVVESNFKQRADSLEAGVSRLTEGLRTKADISSLNVTAENIRQSVKRLETDTQDKLNQKLSLAEFDVRAGSIRQEILNATKDKADKTLVVAEAGKLREEFSSLRVGGTNLLKGSKGPFLPDRKPANFDNNVLYAGQTSIYMEQGQEYIISAKTDGNFTAHHDGNKESDNVVLWIMDKNVSNYQIVSDLKTGTTGTKIIWDKPTGIYHLRVNTYHKEATKSVWDVKIEKGNVATDWSPAPEDTDGLITEAKAIFERTAQGLQTGLSAIQEYVNKDGQRQEALQRYTREESAKQATAVRELVTRDYVGKATYQEDVKGINQRIEAVKTSANKDIASQIASYRQSVDGKFTDISSQITTYKQDLGGQISGLSNRITSSEQGTTTQISNLSNRINSNKQGTDNQISNLKTQVATNKDNAERQMGRISDQVSANKANADSQFANVTNQLARKVETTDFQRVKETSQLYERILGNTENGIADKVARMAMTNQLFQVEVSKASAGGRNLFLNSLFKYDLHQRYSTYHVNDSVEQTQGQLALSIDSNTKFRGANTLKIVSTFNGKPNNQKVTFRTGGDMRLNTADEMRNKSVRFSFWAKSTVNNTNFQARAGNRNAVEGVSLTTDWKFYDIQLTKSENSNASNEVIMHVFTAATVWIAFPKVEIGTVSTPFSEAPEDTDEAIRTVQSQLSGSWAVQNLTSAGSIVSQINATNNQILIEAEKIRLKGKTLLDELTAIQGYFKRLFVGEGTFATLNADVIRTNSITADKLVMDMAMARRFVSSDIFTDTLASKTAFINQLQSVIVSSTLLEGYKGWIGGFQIGTHNSGSGRWITGRNHFAVGIGDGEGGSGRTALWVNWGYSWSSPGTEAWFVKNNGKMFCYNTAEFWSTPVVHGDLKVTGRIRYDGGAWIYSNGYEKIGRSSKDYFYLEKASGARDWFPAWNDASDRRLKSNIQESSVSGIDVINRLKTYSYRKEFNNEVEDISCGIMAQDVQKYAPDAFREGPDGVYTYNTFALVPYLIKAIQELNQKIEKMEKIIA